MSHFNLKLVDSIVKKLGKEGCEHFVKTGELPAIKLTNEEMEFIKGGLFKELVALWNILTSGGRPML